MSILTRLESTADLKSLYRLVTITQPKGSFCVYDYYARLAVGSLSRFEGASDPDDMLAVLGLVCPGCGAKGTVITHYGPTASPGEATVLLAIEGRCLPDAAAVKRAVGIPVIVAGLSMFLKGRLAPQPVHLNFRPSLYQGWFFLGMTVGRYLF